MKFKIIQAIEEFIKAYPKANNAQSTWGQPLIAFAAAKDPGFEDLKRVISPTHAVPTDFIEGAETVIAFFIPFSAEIVSSNIPGKECSREWAVAYIETNQLIKDLSLFLKEMLEKEQYRSAVIPATHNFDKVKLISDWSHRHAAAIAGLGTFGLNNMLITEKGCCGRVGTLVTNARIEPSQKGNAENCLYKAKGICGRCVERCVNGALTAEGYDRQKCYEMCLINDEHHHSDIGLCDVCGKCLVGIPCAMRNPLKSGNG